MKIPNKQKLYQIGFNHSLDTDYQDFMNLYKKCTWKPYSFLVIDTKFASNNTTHKSQIILLIKLLMTINDKVKDKKLQYDSNREAAKIWALSSGKIDKH